MSPRLQLRIRQNRDVGRDRAAGDLAQEHAARRRALRQLGQRLAVHLLAGHVDVDAFGGHRQQLAIVDLFGAGADQVDQHVAPAGDRHDVARLDHGIGGRLDDLVRHGEYAGRTPAAREAAPRLRCAVLPTTCPSSRTRNARNSNWCQAVPGPPDLLLAPVLLLVALARGLEIDAEQRRAEQRNDDGRSDRAEDVGHRIGDRHGVQQLLGLLGRQAETVDRVGRKTHRCRDGLRAGIKSRGGADVVTGDLGDDDRGDQTEHADHRGKHRLRNAILRDAAHELRSDPVADGEQEHQEEESA